MSWLKHFNERAIVSGLRQALWNEGFAVQTPGRSALTYQPDIVVKRDGNVIAAIEVKRNVLPGDVVAVSDIAPNAVILSHSDVPGYIEDLARKSHVKVIGGISSANEAIAGLRGVLPAIGSAVGKYS